MLTSLYYFNSIAVSNKDVPLPANDAEHIRLFCDNVYFRFATKHRPEFVASTTGRFYLSNLRIIYIPASKTAFQSFFVPLNKVFAVESESYLECLCENKYVAVINLNFKSYQNKLFYREIRECIDCVAMEVDPTYIEEEDGDLPYYSDLCDID